jgi:chaperonin GroEL
MARAVRRGRLIVHGDGARAALMRGLDLVADAVAPTLGPAGSHVVLHRHDAGPLITNDGVTIARSIELLRDPYTNQGVQLLRDVAGVADTVAGDGTSTAVLVARELLRQVFSMVTRDGDPASLCDGLRHAWASTARLIRKAAEPLRDDDELAALAGNAARDPSLGEMIARALARVGDDGVINVEDDPAYGVRLEFTDGMSFASGLLSPGLALDEVKGETVFECPSSCWPASASPGSSSSRRCSSGWPPSAFHWWSSPTRYRPRR